MCPARGYIVKGGRGLASLGTPQKQGRSFFLGWLPSHPAPMQKVTWTLSHSEVLLSHPILGSDAASTSQAARDSPGVFTAQATSTLWNLGLWSVCARPFIQD